MKRFVHYVFCTYKRLLLLENGIAKELANIFQEISNKKGFRIICHNILADHVHLLIEKYTFDRNEYVMKMLKGISSYQIFKRFNFDRQVTRKLWGRGYRAYTIRDHYHLKSTIKYINDQKINGIDKRLIDQEQNCQRMPQPSVGRFGNLRQYSRGFQKDNLTKDSKRKPRCPMSSMRKPRRSVAGFLIMLFMFILSIPCYPFYESEVNVRSLALGGCYAGLTDDPDSAVANPAGLSMTDRSAFTTMHVKLQTDADIYYVSYVQPLLNGTVSLSWIQAGTGGIVQTGSPSNETGEVGIIGSFDYYSNEYILSYGQMLGEDLSCGITIKYLTSDLPGLSGQNISSYGYSTAIGLLFIPNDNISFGFKVDDLFNYRNWGGQTVEQVPVTFRTGAACNFPVLGYKLLLSQDISRVLKPSYQPEVCFGAELLVQNMSFRAGYNGSLTGGFGINNENIGINYAYVNRNILSVENVHRVSLTYKW